MEINAEAAPPSPGLRIVTWPSRFGAVTGVAQGPYEGHSLSQDVLCLLARCAVHKNLLMRAAWFLRPPRGPTPDPLGRSLG